MATKQTGIEYAVMQGRGLAGVRAICSWFRREDARLRALGDVAGLRQLHDGYAKSSVRAHMLKGELDKSSDEPSDGIEMRIGGGAGGSSLPMEARTSTTKGGKIVGYAAVTDVVATIGGLFEEVIAGGAFRDVLRDDAVLTFNHDFNKVLARNSRSLRLTEDSRGLRVEADMFPRDGLTGAIRRRILRGDLAKMSFAFQVADERVEFGKGEGGLDRRYILKVARLWDVSVVVFPAYETTSVWIVEPQRAADPPPADDGGYGVYSEKFDREFDERDGQRLRVDRTLNRLRQSQLDGVFKRLGR